MIGMGIAAPMAVAAPRRQTELAFRLLDFNITKAKLSGLRWW
jgi:hypothetical protein